MEVMEYVVDFNEHIKIVESYLGAFNAMKNPIGFTINLHPYLKYKNDVGHNMKRRLSNSDIDNIWSIFSNNLRHAFTFSYERKLHPTRYLAFASVQIGKISGQPHLHGVVDNTFNIDQRCIRWILNQSIRNASTPDNWVCDTDYNFSVDSGWVRYLLREEYSYALLARI